MAFPLQKFLSSEMKYSETIYLTNRPQFFMLYTLIDHRNDVIKCSKLKWNHEPQASGFTAKFWRTFSCCFSYFCSTFGASSTNSFTEISFHMLIFGSLSMLRGKIIFTKNQNHRYCVTCYDISMVSTLIDHSLRPISARGFAQLL